MTQLLNHQFLSDPVGFVQNNVMIPEDGSVTVSRKDHLSTVWDPRNPHDQRTRHYFSIASQHRVVFADLNPGSASAGYRGATVVNFSLNPSAGRIPVFWLPYKQNETVKLTLVDKRSEGVIRKTGGQTRLFLTSAVNGCSVFIEGNAQAPTVFHINSGSFRATRGAITPDNTRKDRLARTAEQVAKWRATLAPQRQTVQNKSPGPSSQTAAVVHGDDYLPNYFQTSPEYQTVLNDAYKQRALNQLGLTPQQVIFPSAQSANADDVRHSGLVFGFKRYTGEWEFWIQERARVHMKDAATLADLSLYVGFRLRKIWPDEDAFRLRAQRQNPGSGFWSRRFQ